MRDDGDAALVLDGHRGSSRGWAPSIRGHAAGSTSAGSNASRRKTGTAPGS